MNPVVASDKLKRAEVWAEDDESVHSAGAFAVYGGHGTTASSTIVYEIEPGKHLGWHTDATEETQYIIAGDGELHMDPSEQPAETLEYPGCQSFDGVRFSECHGA